MIKSIGRFIDNFSRGSRITLGSILLRRDCDFTRCSKIRGAFRVRHFLTRRLRNSTLYLSGFPRICNYCRIVDKIGVSSPPWREKKKKKIIKIWRIKMAFRCSIIIDSNPGCYHFVVSSIKLEQRKSHLFRFPSSPWYVNYILFFHLFTLLDNRKRRKKRR